LVIRDNETTRFTIPKEALVNPFDPPDMRLDMVGFKMSTKNKFEFSY